MDDNNKMNEFNQPIISLIADDEAVQSTFSIFLSHMKTRVDELEACIASQDWGGLKKTAHKVKGSAGCYGFPLLSDQALLLEEQALSEKPAQQTLNEIMKTIRNMIDRIELGLKGS